jgi:hypothetical protein
MYLVAAEAQDASGVDPDSEILLLKKNKVLVSSQAAEAQACCHLLDAISFPDYWPAYRHLPPIGYP